MWVWATLCCLAAAAVGAGATEGCDLFIGFDTYREEILISDVESTNGLAVDFTTNLLYFSHHRNTIWFSAKLDLSNRKVYEIKELTGGCRFAVDQVLQQVHAGCRRGTGLYTFDSNVNEFQWIGEAEQSVNFVYYNDMLYYSVRKSRLLCTFRRGHSVRVKDITSEVEGLVIDKNKDWIFYNSTGLYRQQAGAVEATLYEGIKWPMKLAVDAHGTVYVCSNWSGNIYRLHGRTPNATRLLDVSCYDLTFDRENNMIYSYVDKIVRLVKC